MCLYFSGCLIFCKRTARISVCLHDLHAPRFCWMHACVPVPICLSRVGVVNCMEWSFHVAVLYGQLTVDNGHQDAWNCAGGDAFRPVEPNYIADACCALWKPKGDNVATGPTCRFIALLMRIPYPGCRASFLHPSCSGCGIAPVLVVV